MYKLFFLLVLSNFSLFSLNEWYGYTDEVMGGESTIKWYSYTDQVMGGDSSIETVKDGETFHILGNVSTRNNGGFIRFATNAESISAKAEGIKFLAKANNQTYDIHISLSGMKMPPWSFFFTKFYISEEWQEYKIFFSDFETYGFSMKKFSPENFRELSFAGYGRDFEVNLLIKNIEIF